MTKESLSLDFIKVYLHLHIIGPPTNGSILKALLADVSNGEFSGLIIAIYEFISVKEFG